MSKEIENKIGDGFEFDIHFYGNSGRRSLIEYIKETAKQEAIWFFEWAISEGWSENYDGHDRWIKGRQVLETKNIYDLYQQQREGK